MAAAIANARGMRRGVPTITNILELLPGKLLVEVIEDAGAALDALELLQNAPETHSQAVTGVEASDASDKESSSNNK